MDVLLISDIENLMICWIVLGEVDDAVLIGWLLMTRLPFG
jgi:hypothetical protein